MGREKGRGGRPGGIWGERRSARQSQAGGFSKTISRQRHAPPTDRKPCLLGDRIRVGFYGVPNGLKLNCPPVVPATSNPISQHAPIWRVHKGTVSGTDRRPGICVIRPALQVVVRFFQPRGCFRKARCRAHTKRSPLFPPATPGSMHSPSRGAIFQCHDVPGPTHSARQCPNLPKPSSSAMRRKMRMQRSASSGDARSSLQAPAGIQFLFINRRC